VDPDAGIESPPAWQVTLGTHSAKYCPCGGSRDPHTGRPPTWTVSILQKFTRLPQILKVHRLWTVVCGASPSPIYPHHQAMESSQSGLIFQGAHAPQQLPETTSSSSGIFKGWSSVISYGRKSLTPVSPKRWKDPGGAGALDVGPAVYHQEYLGIMRS